MRSKHETFKLTWYWSVLLLNVMYVYTSTCLYSGLIRYFGQDGSVKCGSVLVMKYHIHIAVTHRF